MEDGETRVWGGWLAAPHASWLVGLVGLVDYWSSMRCLRVERIARAPSIINPMPRRAMPAVSAPVFGSVSYAGPNNDQWKPNGRNRANNAVVFSQLDLCNDSENG
jgi:hypothetical protein